MAKEALSLDLDGPTIWRIIPVQSGATRKYRKHGPSIYAAHPDIRKRESFSPRREVLTLSEYPSFLAHLIRFVFPDAGKALLALPARIDVVGNTGRPDKLAWTNMTQGTLKRGQIWDRLEGVLHKPGDFHTTESKIANIAMLRILYKRLAHADDNPADALPIAATFPDVDVCIVRDLSTDFLLSGVNLERDFPNVTVVSTLRQALEVLF